MTEEVLPPPVRRDPPDPPPYGGQGDLVTGALAGALSTSASTSSKGLVALFLLGGLGLGVVLLGLAAVPTWAVRPVRAALLVEHWRVHLAATGLSTLFMALIVFLLGTSRI